MTNLSTLGKLKTNKDREQLIKKAISEILRGVFGKYVARTLVMSGISEELSLEIVEEAERRASIIKKSMQKNTAYDNVYLNEIYSIILCLDVDNDKAVEIVDSISHTIKRNCTEEYNRGRNDHEKHVNSNNGIEDYPFNTGGN